MNVALVGRYRLPYPYSRHDVDYGMVRSWADELGSLQLVAVGTTRRARAWVDGPLTVHYAPAIVGRVAAFGFVAWAAWKIARLHSVQPVDVVNGSDVWGALAGLAVRRRSGAPVIAQLQGQFLPPARASYGPVARRILHHVARQVCRRVDVVRCLHRAAERDVRRVAPGTRTVVIPSRCDVVRFDGPGGCDDGPFVFVGNLVTGKGLVPLLDALGVVDGAHLEIVGDGPLRDILRAHPAAGRVVFHGRQGHDVVRAVLRRARCLVLPSFSEGTPRAVLEAMAMRVPVIATHVGGLPEMLADGAAGLLVPPGDVGALATAMRHVMARPDWCRAAAAVGRRIVETRYTTAAHTAAMLAVHREAAAGHRAGNGVRRRRRKAGHGT